MSSGRVAIERNSGYIRNEVVGGDWFTQSIKWNRGFMSKKIQLLAAISLLASVSAGATANAANASEASPDRGSTSSITRINKDCEAAIRTSETQVTKQSMFDNCKTVVTTAVSGSRLVTLGEISELRDSMDSSEYRDLSRAVAAGTVKAKNFNQQSLHVASSLTQRGTFYYDGARVWLSSSYRGFTGSHYCQVDWVSGFTIQSQNCYDTGTNTSRTVTQQWLVSPFLGGFPVSWSESYSIQIFADGTVRY
jgi:hypothetical protein